MSSASDVLFVHALSPVHVGSGSSVDIVDLPLIREHATGFPLIPGSSMKGALRAWVGTLGDVDLQDEVFGSRKGADDTAENATFAGAVAFSDARLLLLPVRSSRGVFAMATCAIALRRFQRILAETTPKNPVVQALGRLLVKAGELTDDGSALVAPKSLLAGSARWSLEDLEARGVENADVEAVGRFLAETLLAGEDDYLTGRLCVLPDEVFQYFTEQATEVVARIRIDPKRRTVQRGGLWNEENLPAETVLVGVTHSFGSRRPESAAFRGGREILDALWAKDVHRLHTFGGKETVGHGRVRLSRVQGEVAS